MLLPFLLAAETFLSAHFVLSCSTLSSPPTDIVSRPARSIR